MEGTDATPPYSYVFPIGYSYYAIATSLTPAFYQKLVDRCWRRSGTLMYRPNQKNSCCPHYTLRLDSNQFRPTKDQRQAVNRFTRHVLGETYAREAARRYPRPRAEVRRRNNEFDLVQRIHEPEAQFLKTPPSPAHEFTVTLEPDTFTEEKYDVFENYQRMVHHEPPDKISRHGFKRFLCNSPLSRETIVGPDGVERQLGSFHQCYRIDGKLVAVGVLDLLPDCVSAVYFLYHESIHSLNPGKLGALREIALARERGYRWWYPGYYVHNCAKMRYKIEYRPQYVLDPESLEWCLLDKEALALFDKEHYVTFSVRDKEGGGGGLGAVDMDGLVLRSDFSDNFIVASHLVIWDTEHMSQFGTLKSRIAELVAAVGPDLTGEICIDFRKNR
ncbi:Arginyl-tRNA--protein transferase 1 [Madurella mycetomatis]|uniref:arginyltransferase n=1 Tax=Madurella mycetomatis TaxID=100816 RepID=A0A175WEZ3_9PEZI|nr:Arginyl-tRNA--protein transferase 1 [Madurella mycetomatis]